MKLSSRNILLTAMSCMGVAAVVIACGSEGSKFQEGTNPPLFGEGGFDPDADSNNNADLYKNDPPPPWCGPETGYQPPQIGGTEDCPSDKNKPGCACATLGDKQPCWEGFRKHRGLGICQDGVATCVKKSENTNVWSACEGQVLPKPGATGKEACGCFSIGEWTIKNTSPCEWTNDGNNYYAYSTVFDKGAGSISYCSMGQHAGPGEKPAGIWSTDTLKVDCAGTFDLCFKIRAGDHSNPKDSDCVLGEVCINAVYEKENVVQPLPDLPTWVGTDAACAKKWEKDTPEDVSPGYGEMIVKGKTVRCDAVGGQGTTQDYVFHRVKYCPRICRQSDPHYNPNHPACQDCTLKGSGSFE
jgi:hypothetical protein